MSDILRISLPLTVWLASFSAVYGLQGVACSQHWAAAGLDVATARVVLTAAWIAALAVQVAFVFVLGSPRFASRSLFVRTVSRILAAAGLVTTLWTLFPVVTTSVCI
nr:hypothetical protein [uncultured Steroidobacter sp.]